MGNLMTIDPDGCSVVCRANMQERFRAAPGQLGGLYTKVKFTPVLGHTISSK